MCAKGETCTLRQALTLGVASSTPHTSTLLRNSMRTCASPHTASCQGEATCVWGLKSSGPFSCKRSERCERGCTHMSQRGISIPPNRDLAIPNEVGRPSASAAHAYNAWFRSCKQGTTLRSTTGQCSLHTRCGTVRRGAVRTCGIPLLDLLQACSLSLVAGFLLQALR